MTDPLPDTPPPRTTGGNWRWTPPSAASLERLLPGYSIEKLIGHGGMGAVYKGLQISLERPVAIKILPKGIEREDPTYLDRFHNEAKVMARLLHPAIVTVFDFGHTTDGQLYFVMEYVDGTDVHGLISGQDRLSAEHAHAITAHVCDALAAAHELGIVHRDIKPSNILINSHGQVKVADFGLAKIDDPGQHGLTVSGMALGTPDYVAPESLILGASVDARADLYAVGVMLYQMLTGDLPKGAWKPPSEKVPGLDPRFDRIVIRAMQSEPSDRYPSAGELRRDLDIIQTVPLIQNEAAPTSALPKLAVAQIAGQRSAAPMKVATRGTRPSGATAPVKPEGKREYTAPVRPRGANAGGGEAKIGLLIGGIAAGLALIGGIVFFATRGGGEQEAGTTPAEPVEVAEVTPSPNPPTPKPPASAPKPASTSTPATALSSSSPEPGARVSGSPIPAPDWLVAARKTGGKLHFFGTAPKGATERGRFGEHDDFVDLNASGHGLVAVRANGEAHGIAWKTPDDKVPTGGIKVGPLPIKTLAHGFTPALWSPEKRQVSFCWAGQHVQIKDLPDVPAERFVNTSYHFCLLGADGEILHSAFRHIDTSRDSSDGGTPPPADFFRGATAVTAAHKDYFAAVPGQPVRRWDFQKGERIDFPSVDGTVVDLQFCGEWNVALLTDRGTVSVTNFDGIVTTGPYAAPKDLPPAIAIAGGKGMVAAQMVDGTWRAWGEAKALVEQVEKIGPALALGAYRSAGEDGEYLAWIEAPAAAMAPEAMPTSVTQTEISPAPVVPPHGTPGRVRFFTTDPSQRIRGDFVEDFADIVRVTATPYGWAAQRKNGDVYGVRIPMDETESQLSGPRPFGPVKGEPFLYGDYWRMRDADTGEMINFSSAPTGAGYNRNTQFAPGDATTILGISGHSVALSAEGDFIAQWPADFLKPPPADFFRGATVLATTHSCYLAVNKDGVPRVWSAQLGSLYEAPSGLANLVEAEGLRDSFALRDTAGRIHITTPGLNRTSTLAPQPPADLPPATAVRAGTGMVAIRKADGTWTAWGESPELIQQVEKIGTATDLDLVRMEKRGFAYMLWIEPPAAPPPPAAAPAPVPPAITQTETPATSSSVAATESRLAANLLAQAKAKGGKLRAWGRGPHGPFDVGAAAGFDDFVQISATHFGWAARRAGGEVHAGSWGKDPARPYIPLGPYETSYLSRATLINMVLKDGTSRNVWSESSQQNASKPSGADRVLAVMNHLIRLEPSGKQHWGFGSANPAKPDFFSGATLLTGTYDYFVCHGPGQPVRSWIPKNGTDFTFPAETQNTVEMDGGHDHVVLLDANGAVQVWNADGTALPPDGPFAKDLPTAGGPFVAVRAGRGMSAAQKGDGTWVAWGDSPEVATQIQTIGPALDLDLYHEGDSAFVMWIEPPAETARLTRAATIPADVAQRLAEIDSQFQAAYDRDIAPGHTAAVADLDGKYLAAVNRALDAATAAGNLDESIKLRAEAQRVEAKEPLPAADPEGLPESLKKLRGTYRDAFARIEADRAARAQPYHDRHDALLDAYQRELTQQQRLDDALKVKAHRETRSVGNSVGPAPATEAAAPSANPSTAPSAASTTGEIQPVLDWVFRIGASVTVIAAGQEIVAKSVAELPPAPFEISAIRESGNLKDDLTDRDFASLASFSTLRTINVADARVRITSLAPLARHTGLETIGIRGVDMTLKESELTHLAGLSQLKTLEMRFEEFTGESIPFLKNARGLQTVWILTSKTGSLTVIGAEAIAQMPSLNHLTLDYALGTRNQAALAPLAGAKRLTYLKLDGCDLTPEAFSHIANISGLQILNLNDSKIDNRGFALLAPLAPSLKTLDMQNGATVSDLGIKDAVAALPNLETVIVSHGSTCTVDSLVELAKLPKLKNLSWWTKAMKPRDYHRIAGFPAIRNLHLGYYATLTDDDLEAFAESKTLEFLDISLPQITDKVFPYLTNIKPLKQVNLGGSSVTAAGVASFKAARPGVKVVQ